MGLLAPEARLLLAVAAAEPTASQALVWRAAGQLGIDPDAAAAADLGGLAETGPRVEFRHPLVRSVVYYATPLRQRRLIDQALAAAVTEVSRSGWRGTWGWRRPGRMRRWRPGWSRRLGRPGSAVGTPRR